MEESQFAYWRGQEKEANAVAMDLFNAPTLDSLELKKNALWQHILESYTAYCKS